MQTVIAGWPLRQVCEQLPMAAEIVSTIVTSCAATETETEATVETMETVETDTEM